MRQQNKFLQRQLDEAMALLKQKERKEITDAHRRAVKVEYEAGERVL